MSLLEVLALWYGSGILCLWIHLLYINYIKKQDIVLKVHDIIVNAVLSIAGPLLILVPIFVTTRKLIRWLDINEDTIIWKNKRSKNREILFGKDEK